MTTRVYITVDTEPSIAGKFTYPDQRTPLIQEPVEGLVNGRSEALGFILNTLKTYALSATFYVETVHTQYFINDEMKRYTDLIMRAGQDVQLHLHPCWKSFKKGEIIQPKISDLCASLDESFLLALMQEGIETLKRWTGTAPTSLRTGGFSTSKIVFSAMKTAGLTSSSNICVGYAPPTDESLPRENGVFCINDVMEIPATCFKTPFNRHASRPLQITACSSSEMISTLKQAKRLGYTDVVIVTHPFEFLKKDSPRYLKYKRNALNQSRLIQLCRFLRENTQDFEVSTMASVSTSGIKTATFAPLIGEHIGALRRSAENVLNDKLWIL